MWELREGLRKRGESWHKWPDEDSTTWQAYSNPHTATESMDGTLIVTGLTPAQAIAATLVSEDTYTREDVEGAFVSGYSLGLDMFDSSKPEKGWEQNKRDMDEEMEDLGWVRKDAATRGSGTCVPILNSERDCRPYLSLWFVCSECGCQLTENRLGKVWQKFCPNCGRKVVAE